MATTSQEPSFCSPTDRDPLLVEQLQDPDNHERIVDIVVGVDASSTSSLNSTSPHGLGQPYNESRLSSGSTQVPSSHSSSSSNSRVSSTMRGDEPSHRPWSPFKCSLWFLVELVFNIAQIIASVVALSLSRHENPKAPLFAWVVGYAAGCAASLPVIYWRYLYRNQGVDQNLNQSRRVSPEGNSMLEPNPYITISLNPSSEEEAHQDTSRDTPIRQPTGTPNARVNGLMEHFMMAVDCFFAVWFVVGNVWVYGGHAASSEAPNLYRLCIVFLTISFFGYALPFILCAIICCFAPCIISFLGRGDLHQMRGTTAESINALPAYKFKMKRISSGSDGEENYVIEGGFVGVGTEKERVISGEDAICCICLARYMDNDDLRELPCSHFFHTECVDKWLIINATCPLCKSEVGAGESNGDLLPGESSPQRS